MLPSIWIRINIQPDCIIAVRLQLAWSGIQHYSSRRGRMQVHRQGTLHAPSRSRPLHVQISFGICVFLSRYTFEMQHDWLSACNLFASIVHWRCFSMYGHSYFYSIWVWGVGPGGFTTVHQHMFFYLSRCRVRETSYWHEMWPTCSVPSHPSKIHWSRSHHMMIKI